MFVHSTNQQSIERAFDVSQIETWYVIEAMFLEVNRRADAPSSYFTGYANKDIACYHKASKTVMAADLLFNNPPTEQVGRFSSAMLG